jgi:3-oxoadipate enol-lactonase/4-carboxymuconolactone decarboxylase
VTLPPVVLRDLGGSGPTTLVVGPSLGTGVRTLWEPVAGLLADGVTVVGWELPGHATAPPATGFSLAGLAEAVLAALGAAGLAGACHVAGDSLGGAVALEAALLAPDRVRSVTVLGSGARIGTPRAWAERAALVRSAGTAVLLGSAPDRWFGPGFRARNPEAADALLADLAAADDESYAAACEALARHDRRADLHRVAVPVLAVAGSDDVATPVVTLRQVADGVRHGRLEVLAGVGHLPPVEAPGPVAALLAGHVLADPPAVVTTAQLRAEGMRVRREVLGDAWVDAAAEGGDPLSADFQDFLTRYAWGAVWTRPGLDRRTRSVVAVTALVARGHDEELAAHLRGARANGLGWEEIAEVLLQAGIYCGVPAAHAAFRVAARVAAESEPDAEADGVTGPATLDR